MQRSSRAIFWTYRAAWVVAAVALIALAVAGFQRWRRPRPVPPLGPETTTIANGLHMIRGLGPSVAYVVETSAGPVLIDSGLEGDAATLKAEMARLLIDWRNTQAVLLTHVHGDHAGGAEAIRNAANARVYAGNGDAAVLRAGEPRDAFFSAFYMPNDTPHETTIDVELNGGERLTFGDTTIQAIAAPGHTPGSICYLLERGGKWFFFSGDVVMHLSDAKPLGTYSAYLAPRHRGDATTYLETLRSLRAMPAPDFVLPGHPPTGTEPNRAAMPAERWAAIMDEGISDMHILIARHAADGRDFLDGTPKRLSPNLAYLGDFQGIATYAFVIASKLVLVDAPADADAIAERLAGLDIHAKPSAVLLTSLDVANTGGLRSVVERWGCAVVAGRSEVASAPSAKVVPADALATIGLGAIVAIPLRGDDAPVAYVFDDGEKTAIASGRIPVKFDEEAMAKLAPISREAAVDVLANTQKLAAVDPNLWLPARPWHGQNANVYDSEWSDVIASNFRVRHLQLQDAIRGTPNGR